MSASAPPAAATALALRLAGLRAVFERDFLVFTSRPRFLVLRTLAVALPSLVLLTVLWQASRSWSLGSSRTGQTIFATSAVLLPALVMLLAPVLAASCIASERALNTLQIVLASPVSPFAFVFAKFLSRFGVVLVLVFATLPLAGLCFLFGGVSGGLFLELTAFLVGVAMLGTAAGILASSWSRSVAAAAMSSYFLAIAVPLIHLLGVMSILEYQRPRRPSTGSEMLLEANPFRAWGKLLEGGAFGGVTWSHPGSTFLAWTCGAAALAIVIAGWRLGREAAHEVARKGGPRRAAAIRWLNPVLDRSLRGTLLARPKPSSWVRLGLLAIVIGIILTLAAVQHDLDDEWPHVTFLVVMTCSGALNSLSTSAHSIASEREKGALDMLLASPLSAPEVVRGKFAGTLLGIAPFTAIALVYGLVAAALTKLEFVTLVPWLVGTTVVMMFFAAAGLWCSASASTAGRAVLRAFAFLLGGTVVHAVGTGITMAIVSGSGELFAYIGGLSPLFVGFTGFIVALSKSSSSEAQHMFAGWIIWSAIYVAASFKLLAATAAMLERRNEAR